MLAWLKKLFAPKEKAVVNVPYNDEKRETPAVNSQRVVHLGIIVGHEKKAPGAALAKPYNLSEYNYNSEVARQVEYFANTNPLGVHVTTIFRDGVGISGAYDKAIKLKCDAIIELHFNAFDTKVGGSETLCSTNADDRAFAALVHSEVCAVFRGGNLSRGVKALGRGDRGGQSIYSFPKGANCLVEPFFGDNPGEAKLAMESTPKYAQAIVIAVNKWGRQVKLLD